MQEFIYRLIHFMRPDFTGLLLEGAGDLERPVDCESWLAPSRVELAPDGESLLWRRMDVERSPGKGLLEDFAELHEKPAEAILHFARKWGVLGLCREHNLPPGHGGHLCSFRLGPPVALRGDDTTTTTWWPSDPEAPANNRFPSYSEPLAIWRRFSKAVESILAIKTHLKDNKLPPVRRWEPVYECPWTQYDWMYPFPTEPHLMDRSLDTARGLLACTINWWLTFGNVRPSIDWAAGRTTTALRFSVGGLFGALALQLLLIASGSKGWAICYSCQKPYPPRKRRPKAGQRNFCPTCREAGIPGNLATLDCRRRQKESAARHPKSVSE